jgi:hypothetical protein
VPQDQNVVPRASAQASNADADQIPQIIGVYGRHSALLINLCLNIWLIDVRNIFISGVHKTERDLGLSLHL